MPTIKVYTSNGWLEIPAIKGDPGDLSQVTADTLYAPLVHNHDTLYYTKAEVDAIAATSHTHDDRYYTETEMDALLLSHNHNDLYYPRADTDSLLAGKANAAHDHDASQIITGALGVDRIPSLDSGKITTGILAEARIPVLTAAKIPSLDASKITAGTLGTARIPNLDAGKITTGAFNTARIPSLDASKVTTGVLGSDRIPTRSLAIQFPATHNKTGADVNLRVGPGNGHSAIALISTGTMYDTGYRQTTDETWAYVMMHSLGWGWFPTAQMAAI